MLLSPLSDAEVYSAYVAASIVRGLLVGLGVWIASLIFDTLWINNVWSLLAFGFLGSGILGALGLLGEVEQPRVVAAMEKAIAAARSAGLYVGSGMGPDPDFACAQARRGVQWLQVGGDCSYLVRSADQLTAAIRQRLEG